MIRPDSYTTLLDATPTKLDEGRQAGGYCLLAGVMAAAFMFPAVGTIGLFFNRASDVVSGASGSSDGEPIQEVAPLQLIVGLDTSPAELSRTRPYYY